MFQADLLPSQRNSINRWTDIDASFKINPNTRDIQLKRNEDSVKQHIRLLFIDDGILFRPETNSGVDLQLFDNWNSASKYFLENRIRTHLERFESRINVLDVSTEFDYDTKRLDIGVNYEIDQELKNIDFKFIVRSVR